MYLYVEDADAVFNQAVAAGAKAIIYNVPNMAVMKQLNDIANENHVFLATYFGYTGDILPGDFGPYWVVDNTPFSDEQTFIPLTMLMQKMRDAKKTKLLIHQASKSAATVSTVYINLGIYQALQNYPEMKLMGFQELTKVIHCRPCVARGVRTFRANETSQEINQSIPVLIDPTQQMLFWIGHGHVLLVYL
jgi:hypothetical protein